MVKIKAFPTVQEFKDTPWSTDLQAEHLAFHFLSILKGHTKTKQNKTEKTQRQRKPQKPCPTVQSNPFHKANNFTFF